MEYFDEVNNSALQEVKIYLNFIYTLVCVYFVL